MCLIGYRALPVVVTAAFFAVRQFGKGGVAVAATPAAVSSPFGPAGLMGDKGQHKPMTDAEYAAQFRPRLAGIRGRNRYLTVVVRSRSLSCIASRRAMRVAG